MNVLIISESVILKEALSFLFNEKFEDVKIKTLSFLNDLSEDINLFNTIIIDIREENIYKLEVIKEIKKDNKDAKIIVYNTYKDENICVKAIRNGADAYITDIEEDDDFEYIVKKVMTGGKFYDSVVIQKAINKKEFNNYKEITIRENEVIKEVSKGFSNREIAKKLGVTEYTIKKHITNILLKLNLRNRQDIIIHFNKLE